MDQQKWFTKFFGWLAVGLLIFMVCGGGYAGWVFLSGATKMAEAVTGILLWIMSGISIWGAFSIGISLYLRSKR